MSSSPTYLDPVVVPLVVGESVLDVACGYGRWGALITNNFWEASLAAPPAIDGFDAFLPNVVLCRQHGYYRKVWEQTLPAKLDQQWDTVLACEILEHLRGDELEISWRALESAARRRIIVTSPNWHYLREGGKTIVGFNPWEAHYSWITRAQLRRRGYRIIGAGFGNPTIRWVRLLCRRYPNRHRALHSLVQLFPALAETIVAYRDT